MCCRGTFGRFPGFSRSSAELLGDENHMMAQRSCLLQQSKRREGQMQEKPAEWDATNVAGSSRYALCSERGWT
ncbi:hypothetical protein PISMIDRAFT_684276 [Pisolithus microcarpus 441]|uniref:Uncharacterized protein n=1 Tax=Pisolithus microcarpus 441 TaxID=765257 RepID=A0A0C9Z7K4_9AGAM|nr:hypothetical protein PISMIDRAFT_684276 [Pisolithus microcarpus 441]